MKNGEENKGTVVDGTVDPDGGAVTTGEGTAPTGESAGVTTTTGTTALAPVVATGSAYIAVAIKAKQEAFLTVNAGLDLDYVRMGQYLKINKKGNFIEARDETVSYGDTMDVVIAQGEQRWTLWGMEDSPEDGQLIVSHRDQATAVEMLENWLTTNPDAANRYDVSDIQLRYTAFIVPISANGQVMLSPTEAPKIYLMSFASGDTYGWGNYAMNIFDGKYKQIGVPANTAANHVVTRIVTEVRDRKGSTDTYLGIKFDSLGLFNPSDYGITVD